MAVNSRCRQCGFPTRQCETTGQSEPGEALVVSPGDSQPLAFASRNFHVFSLLKKFLADSDSRETMKPRQQSDCNYRVSQMSSTS
ncbi:hypothetical protein TNCV_4465521 [Trichonephila clavipes]|nr:hypothetical protein TNCV_4465521 [Trichonephila clavipes]